MILTSLILKARKSVCPTCLRFDRSSPLTFMHPTQISMLLPSLTYGMGFSWSGSFSVALATFWQNTSRTPSGTSVLAVGLGSFVRLQKDCPIPQYNTNHVHRTGVPVLHSHPASGEGMVFCNPISVTDVRPIAYGCGCLRPQRWRN